jgi:large subunit ribosomal protein L5
MARFETSTPQLLVPDLLLKDPRTPLAALPRLRALTLHTTSHRYGRGATALAVALVALQMVTGQTPRVTTAHRAHAPFHLRQGQLLGARVTLRGRALFRFLDQLTTLTLPRRRDWRGLPPGAVSSAGTLGLGLPQLLAFPPLHAHVEWFGDLEGADVHLATTAPHAPAVRLLASGYQLPLAR